MRVVKKESGPNVEIRRMLFKLLDGHIVVSHDVNMALDAGVVGAEAGAMRVVTEEQLKADILFSKGE